MYCVCHYIDHFIHIMFFLSLLHSSWFIHRTFYIYINLSSNLPNATKPASGQSPWGAPKTEINLPRSTPSSAGSLVPNSIGSSTLMHYSPQHHWDLTPDAVQSLTPFIPHPWCIPATPVKDGNRGSPICQTPRDWDKTDHCRIQRMRALTEVVAQIAKEFPQGYIPQQRQYKRFWHEWWRKSCKSVSRDQQFPLLPL